MRYFISSKSDYPKIASEEAWKEWDKQFYIYIGYNGNEVSNGSRNGVKYNPGQPIDSWERTVKVLGLKEIAESDIPRNPNGELMLTDIRFRETWDYNSIDSGRPL